MTDRIGPAISRFGKLLPVFVVIALLPVLMLSAGSAFEDSGQTLGGDTSYDVALADLDSDDDLDAFVANGLGNRVWINQGGAQGGEAAVFHNSGQSPGLLSSRGAALADLDNNQTIDAFVANNGDKENEVWLNNGSAVFSLDQQLVSANMDSQDVALGLLNNDPFPDAFIANNGANEVWLNNGSGTFTPAQDDLGTAVSHEVVLGDIDLDGDLDAYVANGTTSALADELWFNNGAGQFTASAQVLDLDWNEGAALGDLDDDGDLDLYLAAWFGMDAVWINQGGMQGGTVGVFADSGQTLGQNGGTGVALLDADGDSDLDAVISRFSAPNEVWLNNGSGQFSDSGQALGGNAGTYAVAAGDLDQDSDADLFFANFGANHVFLQGGLGLPGVWFDVAARQDPQGHDVLPWTQQNDAQLPVALGFPAPEALTVNVEIASETGLQTQALPFAAGESAVTLVVPNPAPAISETMTLSLTVEADDSTTETLGQALQRIHAGAAQVNPLKLLFVNEQSGPVDCVLCMMDWVLKLAGFEPSFWQLHHVSLADLRTSPAWDYYQDLFRSNEEELTTIMLTHPALLWATFDTLQMWTPGIMAADNGQGDTTIITTPQAQGAAALLQDIAGAAGPALAQRITFETEILDFPALGGKSMDQALQKVRGRVQGQIYLPVTARN